MRSMVTVTTPRTETQLVSLETLKAELQITSTENDEFLTGMIDRLSSWIEAYCGRVFSVEGVSEVFRFGSSASVLILTRRPVVEITTVVESGTELADTDYEVDPETGELFRLVNDDRSCWGGGKVTIEYTGGYAIIPGAVQQQFFQMAKLGQASRTRDPSLRSENILEGLYSYTLFSPGDSVGGMPPDVAAGLDAYRVPYV